jgi:hypothetical protein
MRACLHSKGRRRRRNQRLSSSAAVWTVAIRRMGASARRSSIANPARGSRRSRRASWPPPGRQAWQSPSSADCRNDRHDRSDFVCLESDPFHPNVSSPKTPEVDRRRSDLSFKHHAEVKAFRWTKSRRGQLPAGRRLLLGRGARAGQGVLPAKPGCFRYGPLRRERGASSVRCRRGGRRPSSVKHPNIPL